MFPKTYTKINQIAWTDFSKKTKMWAKMTSKCDLSPKPVFCYMLSLLTSKNISLLNYLVCFLDVFKLGDNPFGLLRATYALKFLFWKKTFACDIGTMGGPSCGYNFFPTRGACVWQKFTTCSQKPMYEKKVHVWGTVARKLSNFYIKWF